MLQCSGNGNLGGVGERGSAQVKFTVLSPPTGGGVWRAYLLKGPAPIKQSSTCWIITVLFKKITFFVVLYRYVSNNYCCKLFITISLMSNIQLIHRSDKTKNYAK